MDEDADEVYVEGVEAPAYPFVSSAALADAMELGAAIGEASAALLRAYAERLKYDHNHKVDVAEAMDAARAELEMFINPTTDEG